MQGILEQVEIVLGRKGSVKWKRQEKGSKERSHHSPCPKSHLCDVEIPKSPITIKEGRKMSE